MSDWSIESIEGAKSFLKNFSFNKLLFGDKNLRKELPEILSKSKAEDIVNKFQDEGYGSIKDSIKDFETSDKYSKTQIEALKKFAESGDTATVTVQGLTRASKELHDQQEKTNESFSANGLLGKGVGLLKTLGTTLANVGVSMLATLAIEAVANKIYETIHATEIAIEKGKEAQQTIKDINDEFDSKKDFVDDSGERFGELREGVDGNTNKNMSLTNDEYEEYLSLCNEIADIYPELVASYDAQGNAILNLGSSAETVTAQLQDLLKADQDIANIKIADNLQTVYEGAKAEVKEIQKTIDEYKKEEEINDTIIKNLDSASVDSVYSQLDEIASGKRSYLELSNFDAETASIIRQSLYDNGFNISTDAGQRFFDDDGDGIAERELLSLWWNMAEEQVSGAIENVKDSIATGTYDELQKAFDMRSENAFKVSSYNKEIAGVWTKVLPSIQAAFKINPNYTDLSEEIQNGIMSLIGGIDISTLEIPDDKDLETYLKEKYLHTISNVMNDTSNEQYVKNAQNAIQEIFSLPTGELNSEEYTAALDEQLAYLKNYFIKAGKTQGFDGGQYYQDFIVNLGFKTIDEDGNIVDSKAALLDKLEDIATEEGSNVDELNLDELTVDQLIAIETRVEYNNESVEKAVEATKKDAENIVNHAESIKFSSLLGEDSKISTAIDEYQDVISKIQTAQENLQNGELVGSTLTDLYQDFPELISQTDDLGAALSNLSANKATELISSIRSEMENITDPDELANGEKLIRSIIDSLEFSNVDIDSLKEQTRKFFEPDSDAYSLQDFAMQKTQQFYSEFAPEIQTEKGREILFTIIADPANAELTIEQLREKYNDEEIIYNLKIRDENITKLENELSRIQDETSAIQDNNSFKESQGYDLTESDYLAVINKAGEGIKANNKLIDEARLKQQELLDAGGSEDSGEYVSLEKDIRSYESAIRGFKQTRIEAEKSIADIPETKLKNQLDVLQAEADIIDSMNYDALRDNADAQIAVYESLISMKNAELEGIDPETQSELWASTTEELNGYISAIDNLNSSKIEWDVAVYENQLSVLEDEASKIKDAMSLKETQGFDLTKSDYTSAINNSQQEVEVYKNLIGYYKELKENSKVGSEGYITAVEGIISCESAIRSATQSQLEWNQAIADLPETKYNNQLSVLQSQSSVLDSNDYNSLINNANDQIALYDILIKNKQSELENIDAETQSGLWAEATEELNGYISARKSLESDKIDWGIAPLENELNVINAEAEKIKDTMAMKEAQGFDLTKSDYTSSIKKAQEEIDVNQKMIERYREEQKGYNEGSAEYLYIEENIRSCEAVIRSATQSQLEWNQAIDDLPETKLNNKISVLKSQADILDDKDYKGLIDNANDQITFYDTLIAVKQKELDGVDPEEQTGLWAELTSELSEFVNAKESLESSKIDWEIGNSEDIINGFDREITALQDAMSLDEAIGNQVSEKSYQALIDKIDDKNKELSKENEVLEALLLTNLPDSQKETILSLIADNESKIISGEEQIQGYYQSIRNIPLDKLSNELSVLQDEASYIEKQMSLRETEGHSLTKEDYELNISKADEEIATYKRFIAEQRKIQEKIGSPDNEQYIEAEENIRSYQSAIIDLQISQAEWEEHIRNLPLDKLSNELTSLQEGAQAVQDAMSLKEAKGIKASVNDYKKLISNSKLQVQTLQKQNAELQKQLVGLEATDAKYQEIQSQINSNLSAIDAARMSQLEWNEAAALLNYEPDEGLIAYNKAKETRNAGDNYLDMLSAAKEAQEAREKGLVGTDDFKTAAKMFSPNGMADYSNWDENYGKIQRYFTEDSSGVKNFLNDLSEKTNIAGEALAECNKETGEWTYNIDDVQTSADALGISFEAFLAIMGRLQDYGFTNDFFSSVDEGQDHIADLYSDLYEAEKELERLEYDRDHGDATITDTVLSAQESRVNQIKQSILESQNLLDELLGRSTEDYEQKYSANMATIAERLKKSVEIKDDGARKAYIQDIIDWAESENIELPVDILFDESTVNEDVLNKLLSKYSVDTTYSTEYSDRMRDGIGEAITSGMENSESGIKPLVDSLAQYTNEQFASITFGDNTLGEGAIGEAETAIDQLLKSLNLGQEHAQLLLEVLGELGYIDYSPEINTENVVTETQGAVTQAQTVAEENPVIIPMKTAPQGNIPTVEEAATQVLTMNIVGNNELAIQSTNEAKEYGDQQDSKITVGADTSSATSEVNSLVARINHRTANIKVGANTTNLVNDINNVLSGTRTINLRAQVIGGLPTGVIGPANGTAHAHANGTAYSMWSDYRHSVGAYANGTNQSWGLKNDETALVNELGVESRVRNGQWELIPGGAHFESFKKGDIIFNHKQTAELLKYGHVVSDGGRGRIAHADGTAFNMVHAYANPPKNSGSFVDSSSTSNLQQTVNKLGSTSGSAAKKVNKLDDAIAKLDKLFDWIEVRLDRIQKDIDYDTALADNAVGYKKKNEKISSAQTNTKALVSANEIAANRYSDQAKKAKKKVGLSDKLWKRLLNGSLDADAIQELSEDDKKRVDAVQPWVDKMYEAQLAVEQTKTSLKELAQTKLDNITEEFDAILSHIEHSADMINGYMEQAEVKGYADSAKYYEGLKAQSEKSISQMEKERAALVSSLQESLEKGDIAEGSVEWYNMQAQINEVSKSIQDANTQVAEYNDNIRQIEWDRFDKQRESVARLTEEADFLIDLMSSDDLFDDKGNITDAGLATAGLHGQNYNVYMEQANEYAAKAAEIQKQIAKEPWNTKLIDQYEEYIDKQRESILAAEDEKQAIKDLVQEGIDKELEALDELIDKYTEALDSQKDLNDYQKTVADKSKEVAKIQKQLKAYENDDSEEGKSKRQKLEAQLKEAQEDLQETEYDKYISDQKDLLSDLYD